MHRNVKAPPPRCEDYNMAELQFSKSAQQLSQILDQHSLPRVIQCDKRTAPPTAGGSLDLSKPLLAYSKRSVRKVHAYNVVFDSRSRDFLPRGNNLLVPEDYTGWFCVLGSPETVSQDLPVPYYSSLLELPDSKCSTFLTAGNNLLDAFLMQSRHQIPCKILPGTLLHVMCGLYPEVEPPTKGNRPKKGGKFTPRSFVKCIDEQDREFLVCTSQTGRFHVIEQSDVPVSHPIMQMKTILEKYKLPLLVKLVYGRVPTTPCSFTSTLLLTNCGKNHTVVASTLLNGRNINLEIPIATDMKFHIAEESPGLTSSKIYMNAVRICREQVFTYVKNIKVLYGEPLLENDETDDTSKKDGSGQSKNDGSGQSKNDGSDQTEVKSPPQDDCATVQLRRSTANRSKRGVSVLSRSNMDEILKRLTITEEDPAMFSQLDPENSDHLDSVKESNESVSGCVETSPPLSPHDAATAGTDDDSVSRGYNDLGDRSFTHDYDNLSFTGSFSGSSDTSSEYATSRDSLTSTISIPSKAGQPTSLASENGHTPVGEQSSKSAKEVKPKIPPKPSLPKHNRSDDGGYITPKHVVYPKSKDERCPASCANNEPKDDSSEQNLNDTQNIDRNVSNGSAHTYMELTNDNEIPQTSGVNSTDSGIVEDTDVTLAPNDQEIPNEEGRYCRHDIKGPSLPSRAKVQPTRPPPKTLGQAVVTSVSGGSDVKVPSFDQSNRHRLIKELQKAGISPTTRMAFQGLEAAKITMLLQCNVEDVQDQLIALLPKVGQVDLRIIAECLRGMKLT